LEGTPSGCTNLASEPICSARVRAKPDSQPVIARARQFQLSRPPLIYSAGCMARRPSLEEFDRTTKPPRQLAERRRRLSGSENPAVIFTARLEGDRLLLPREVPAPAESVAFVRHRQEGEAREFTRRDVAHIVWPLPPSTTLGKAQRPVSCWRGRCPKREDRGSLHLIRNFGEARDAASIPDFW
jgi:hypothetical protein